MFLMKIMMLTYRFVVNELDDTVIINYGIDQVGSVKTNRELLNKWIETEISVSIIEFGLRCIVSDHPTFVDIKKILFLEMIKRSIYRSSDFKDAYREIKAIMNYLLNHLEISTEEAMLILESGITKATLLVNHIDIVTILNEREVHGT